METKLSRIGTNKMKETEGSDRNARVEQSQEISESHSPFFFLMVYEKQQNSKLEELSEPSFYLEVQENQLPVKQ